MSGHYIRLDSNNRVIKGFSTDFEEPKESDICINQNGDRHFKMFGEVNPNLTNELGVYLYKYENGEVVARVEEEINLEILTLPAQPKTEFEIMKETLDALIQTMLSGGL